MAIRTRDDGGDGREWVKAAMHNTSPKPNVFGEKQQAYAKAIEHRAKLLEELALVQQTIYAAEKDGVKE